VSTAYSGRLSNIKGEGDSTFSVFVHATDAVAAAATCQSRLAAEQWPEGAALRVRAAVVTGEAVERNGDYHRTTVHCAARFGELANGGEAV